MIDYRSEVMFLDTKACFGERMMIKDIFLRYAEMVSWFKNDSCLKFSHSDYKYMVQDWNGYTEIQYIVLYERPIDIWYIVTSEHGNTITISEQELVNVYEPEETKIGFHGEVKYTFKPTPARDIKGEVIVREYNIDADEEHPVQFSKATCDPVLAPYIVGCDIVTKSGHCTINNFDCYASGYIPNKEKLFK